MTSAQLSFCHTGATAPALPFFAYPLMAAPLGRLNASDQATR